MNKVRTNILIAVFMGWKIDNSFPDKGRVYRSPKNYIEFDVTFKFHSDWNLLMDVIEKIQRHQDNRFTISLRGNSYELLDNYHINPKVLFSSKAETTIDAAYDLCVQFIESYNKQY